MITVVFLTSLRTKRGRVIIGKVIRPFHSTVFNLQAARRELVLCVLPLILSMRSLKKSIVGKPVQFQGSIQIPQGIIHRKAPAVRGITLTVPGTPLKANSVAFAMENRPQSLITAFILGPCVTFRVCYESITSDPRVHARG